MIGKFSVKLIDATGSTAVASIWLHQHRIDDFGVGVFLPALRSLSNASVIGWDYTLSAVMSAVGAGDVTVGGVLYYDNGINISAIAVPALRNEYYLQELGNQLSGMIITEEPELIRDIIGELNLTDDVGNDIGDFVIGALVK